jgi:transformation/transcription domain-associated protein
VKHSVACELREMVDTVHESARVFSHLVPALIDMLRSGEPAFRKDALEYQFRRVLMDIIHRCPPHAHVQTIPIYSGLLHILHHDNEENGVTCCKTMIDLVRTHRTFPEEVMSEFMTIVQTLLQNMSGLVDDILSESSSPLDSNTLLPSIRSFKVAAEVGLVLVTFSSSPQISRQLVAPAVQSTLSLHFDVLALQAPQQQKAREDHEAMGGIWAGVAPTIVNQQAYADFIQVQIKVCFCVQFLWRHILNTCLGSFLHSIRSPRVP